MLRSTIFNIGFYIGTALILLLAMPLLLGKRSWAMTAMTLHAHFVLWWMKLIIGTKIEIRGLKHLQPFGGKRPVLIASKHQSAWETFAFPTILNDPALVLKQELLSIPVYGWFCQKLDMIPIRRERASLALKGMIIEAEKRKIQNREILIFPEGTRMLPGSPPNYKSGILKLYESLDIPCIPVALNSGLYWPKATSKRYKGTIIIEFLPPIQPGLDRKHFKAELQGAIEQKCEQLRIEGLKDFKQ